MKITTAKSAGFCFGVERAVDTVLKAIDSGKNVSTLGPIIHNPQMVEQLRQKGVGIINNLSEYIEGKTIIIRSHGVSKSIISQMQSLGIDYIDATCPFVTKIHKIVGKTNKNDVVIIAGDQNHPEVLGIIGHTPCSYLVISSADDLQCNIIDDKINYIMVAQTTFNMAEWEKCIVNAKKLYTRLQIFDTICNATAVRQQEANRLAQNSDIMIVVGGRHSSNTAKLAHICEKHTRTLLIESGSELKNMDFENIKKVGITAGASTPVCIIKEVQETMNEINNNNESMEEELSFAEMLDQSFKSTYNGERVTAVVTGIAPNEISVDIGTKHAGYVPLSELTENPNAKCEDIVAIGDKVDLLVVRVNDVEGTVMLSKKRLDAMAGFEKVMQAVDTGEIFEGIVTEVIKGGVLALTNGVKVFIPASHATVSRNEELTTLLKKKISFKILEANRQRRRAVGSVREVLKEERKVIEEKFWNNVNIGDIFNGTVKSMTDYGAFIDLGGVDGMVHISELSWQKIKHPSQVLKVGENVEVYIKDIDAVKKKISLGYKKSNENPWEILKNTCSEGDTANVKIVSLTAFGAFAEIIPGIDGLIHISQMSLERVNRPADVLAMGQQVDVKITEIDYQNRRISLSIKALLTPENNEESEEFQQDNQ